VMSFGCWMTSKKLTWKILRIKVLMSIFTTIFVFYRTEQRDDIIALHRQSSIKWSCRHSAGMFRKDDLITE
jgi:hypothetical protein